MLITRYFGLLLAYHLVSFLKLWPWAYVWGIVTWPVWFVRCLMIDGDSKKHCVAVGAATLLAGEGVGALPAMPKFLRKRFETIHQEAVS